MKSKAGFKNLVVAGMLCAVAFLCMFVFRIKVSFLTFDVKDTIIAITSLLYGPIYGVISAAVVALLEFLSVSDTGVYGLIMNFLSSGTFALTCGLIYRYKRTFQGAILAVCMSVVSVTTVMMLANLFITPLFMGVETDVVIGMLLPLLLPFNLVKSVVNAAITLAVYKPFSVALKKTKPISDQSESTYKMSMRSVLLLVVSVLVVVLGIFVLILWMQGQFEWIRS